jgi:hypothetical protein
MNIIDLRCPSNTLGNALHVWQCPFPRALHDIKQEGKSHYTTTVLKSTINIYQLTTQIYTHLPNGSEIFKIHTKVLYQKKMIFLNTKQN